MEPFPILNLPPKARSGVIGLLTFLDMLSISFCSKRCKKLAESRKFPISAYKITVTNHVLLYIRHEQTEVKLVFFYHNRSIPWDYTTAGDVFVKSSVVELPEEDVDDEEDEEMDDDHHDEENEEFGEEDQDEENNENNGEDTENSTDTENEDFGEEDQVDEENDENGNESNSDDEQIAENDDQDLENDNDIDFEDGGFMMDRFRLTQITMQVQNDPSFKIWRLPQLSEIINHISNIFVKNKAPEIAMDDVSVNNQRALCEILKKSTFSPKHLYISNLCGTEEAICAMETLQPALLTSVHPLLRESNVLIQNFDKLSQSDASDDFRVVDRVTLDELLLMNSKLIYLPYTSLTEKDGNRFLKEWTVGSMPRMINAYIGLNTSDPIRKHRIVRGLGNVKEDKDGSIELDLQSKDGRKAKVYLFESVLCFCPMRRRNLL